MLVELGSSSSPLRRRNTLLLFLAQNPDLINTPRTPQESYRKFWMDSLDHNTATMGAFVKRSNLPKSRNLKFTLCNSGLIGLTKFSIETCEMLSMSKITDLDWLSKGNVGMEVCVSPIA